MYKLFMAFRYLRAHKIIYFSITGVALGIMVLVVVTSIMGGFSRNMRLWIRGMQTHVEVVALDKNLWFKDYEAVCADLEKLPHVTGCAPRIEWDAWLGFRGVRRDVHLVGIVPEKERGVSDLEKFFIQGGKSAFDFNHDTGGKPELPGVVLGCEIGVGDKVSLMTAMDSTTPILCVRDFERVGEFKTKMNEYDARYLFMSLSSAQSFLRMSDPPRVNMLAIAVDDYEQNGTAVRRAIVDRLHARKACTTPSFHVYGRCGLYLTRTWEQAKVNLLQAVEVEKGIQIIILFMIVLVAGFNIIAIYTLVVRSKTRDIGILRALGATERGVLSIFLTSGGLCGLFGSIFGIGLGLLIAYNINEIAGFIRLVSYEMNLMGYPGLSDIADRGGLVAVTVLLAGALVAVIWNWLALYKERIRTPWGRIITAFVVLVAAAYFSTPWLKPGQRMWLTAGTASVWMIAVAGWRLLDRWRRRPAWTFFGFAWTLLFSSIVLAVTTVNVIAAAILANDPDASWRGLELFPPNIYYLSEIPVCVDYTTLGFIVAMTIAVSLVFSIYPAMRAAACDPIEAIRDE